MSKIKKLTGLAVVAAFTAVGVGFASGGSAFAATKTFVGSASDQKWSTASNWQDGTVPASGDDITMSGQYDGTDDITGLNINSVTFSNNSTTNNCPSLTASTTLTINSAITSNACAPNAALYGQFALGGDVVAKGVTFYGTTGGTNLNLSNHKITFEDAATMPGGVAAIGFSGLSEGNINASTITGSGTVEFNAPKTLNQNVDSGNTYSGQTILNDTGDAWLTASKDSFGTSSVTINKNAALYFDLSDADKDATISNPITINGQTGYMSVNFNCSNSSVTTTDCGTIKVPHITLNSNVALGTDPIPSTSTIKIDLTGITTNNHCVEYWQGSGIIQSGSATDFIGGPTACAVDAGNAIGTGSAGSGAKASGTGDDGAFINNPAVIAGAGAAVIALVAAAGKFGWISKLIRR
ncbi:MAG: hypothetical protein LBM73_00365 [Candidatus Nomurabacteria bacterium]|jgi:hypothetical protein|nr:hypothetical protein [Candidatus Nomurabacteria bacterium]